MAPTNSSRNFSAPEGRNGSGEQGLRGAEAHLPGGATPLGPGRGRGELCGGRSAGTCLLRCSAALNPALLVLSGAEGPVGTP